MTGIDPSPLRLLRLRSGQAWRPFDGVYPELGRTGSGHALREIFRLSIAAVPRWDLRGEQTKRDTIATRKPEEPNKKAQPGTQARPF